MTRQSRPHDTVTSTGLQGGAYALNTPPFQVKIAKMPNNFPATRHLDLRHSYSRFIWIKRKSTNRAARFARISQVRAFSAASVLDMMNGKNNSSVRVLFRLACFWLSTTIFFDLLGGLVFNLGSFLRCFRCNFACCLPNLIERGFFSHSEIRCV